MKIPCEIKPHLNITYSASRLSKAKNLKIGHAHQQVIEIILTKHVDYEKIILPLSNWLLHSIPRTGYNTVHAGGREVKKRQNSAVHVVVE